MVVVRYFITLQVKHIVGAFFTCFFSFYHVFALLDGGNGRSIGRRTSDTQFLLFAHKACFRVAGRVLGETFGSGDTFMFELLSFFQRGQ